jgi:hypothetical protein
VEERKYKFIGNSVLGLDGKPQQTEFEVKESELTEEQLDLFLRQLIGTFNESPGQVKSKFLMLVFEEHKKSTQNSLDSQSE